MKSTNQVIYDQRYNRIGFLFKSYFFGKYVIRYEGHNLYFRTHPKNWAKDDPVDQGRFIVLGKLR